jgi:hypothetical protein
MRTSICSAIVVGVAVLGAAPVSADNGVQTRFFTWSFCSPEMPLPDGTTDCPMPPAYVDCLGEFLVGSHDVLTTYRTFTTASGVEHLMDNWRYSSLFYGVSSGRAWVAKGVSPFGSNSATARGATTSMYVEHQTMKPIADGQMFTGKVSYLMTWNADGELVVDKPRFDDIYHCIGPVR